MKGVTSIGPHSPFRILRKGGKVDNDDDSSDATEQQDNTQSHGSLEEPSAVMGSASPAQLSARGTVEDWLWNMSASSSLFDV